MTAKTTTNHSRRSMLGMTAGLGAATIATACVAVHSAKATGKADKLDAKLLELGREFDARMPGILEMHRECDRLQKVLEAEQQKRGIWPGRNWKEWCALRVETGIEPAATRLNDVLEVQDATARAIRETPAHTLAGLVVKVRAHGYDAYHYQAAEIDDEVDWEVECFLGLLKEVERLAAQEATR